MTAALYLLDGGAILSNPLTDPRRHLLKYAGVAYHSLRRDRTFRFEAADMARYATLEVVPDAVPMLVLLTEDDPLVDHRKALDVFGARENATLRVFATGGHTIDLRTHPAREVVRAFVAGG